MSRLKFFLLLLVALHGPSFAQNINDLETDSETAERDASFPEYVGPESAIDRLRREAKRIFASRNSLSGTFNFQAGDSLKGIIEKGNQWKIQTLKVCLIVEDGSPLPPETWREIVETASEWNSIQGVPDFDFGDMSKPRKCERRKYEIAIGIFQDRSFAITGTRGSSIAWAGKANLGLQASILLGADKLKRRQVILHEFGHVLGLEHEIKHADGQCWDKLNKPKLYAYYKEKFNQTDQIAIKDQINYYDPSTFKFQFISVGMNNKSIMMYSFPKEIYDDKSPPCVAPFNSEIAKSDIDVLTRAYDRDSGALMLFSADTAWLTDEDRGVTDALIALAAANAGQQKLLYADLAELPDGADAKMVAGQVFETLHGAEGQRLEAFADSSIN